MSAITGRYILRVRLLGLSPFSNTASPITNLPYQLAQVLAFPTSDTWRVTIRIEQQSSIDGSVQVVYRTIPLSKMLPETVRSVTWEDENESESSGSNVKGVVSRAVELDLRRMVSTDILRVRVGILYSIGKAVVSEVTTVENQERTPRGMSVPIFTTKFDLIDTCVPDTMLSSSSSLLPFNVTTRTEDELVCDVQSQMHRIASSSSSSSSSSLSSLSASSASSASASLSSTSADMILRQDVTPIMSNLMLSTASGNIDETVEELASSESSADVHNKKNTLVHENIDRQACGRLVASILGGGLKRWRWEQSTSPGYVASHGMLWGGHRVTLLSRLVRVQNGSKQVFLEIRVSCTDSSRLPMLRQCLVQRIQRIKEHADTTVAEQDHVAVSAGDAAAGDGAIANRKRGMTLHVDQTLRGVEQKLSSCRLRLRDMSKLLTNSKDSGSLPLNMFTMTSDMQKLYEEVAKAYTLLRSTTML